MDEQGEQEALNAELLAKQQYRRGPVRIRETVAQLMARRGYGQTRSKGQQEQAWREACGEQIAAHSRTGNLVRGVLTVFVRNSTVLQELTFQQQQLVERLGEIHPDLNVRSIKLRVGVID